MYFLDLRKVFAMVDHHALCKLEDIGVGNTLVQWIEDYVTDHRQITKINNAQKVNSICEFELPIDNEAIEAVSSFKYLGIMIDVHLKLIRQYINKNFTIQL